jgi:hypothetical protein
MEQKQYLIEYGKLDANGDIIAKGAIKNIPQSLPATINFDPAEVVGIATLSEDQYGISFTIKESELDEKGNTTIKSMLLHSVALLTR